jgi:hypothetical protein
MAKKIEKVPLSFVLMAFVPPLHMAAVAGQSVYFLLNPAISSFLGIAGVAYLLPVALYRAVSFFYPIEEGIQYLDEPRAWRWIFAIKLQHLFITFPAFERVLILIPGAFSLWLRLWGSKIGWMVLWSPHTEVSDRTHLQIDHLCFFGHRVYLTTHAVKMKNGRPQLYFRGIKIGSRVFVGASANVGPGVEIGPEVQIPFGANLYPNEKVTVSPPPVREPLTATANL